MVSQMGRHLMTPSPGVAEKRAGRAQKGRLICDTLSPAPFNIRCGSSGFAGYIVPPAVGIVPVLFWDGCTACFERLEPLEPMAVRGTDVKPVAEKSMRMKIYNIILKP